MRLSSCALIVISLLVLLPFGLALAKNGLDALSKDPHLAKGLIVLRGEVTHPAVAEALGKPAPAPTQ